jgi:hypothetical protein
MDSSSVRQRNLEAVVFGKLGMDAIQCAYLCKFTTILFKGREIFINRSPWEDGDTSPTRASCGKIQDMMMLAMAGGTRVTFETWLMQSEFDQFEKLIFLLPGDICYDRKNNTTMDRIHTNEKDSFLNWVLNLNLPENQRMLSPVHPQKFPPSVGNEECINDKTEKPPPHLKFGEAIDRIAAESGNYEALDDSYFEEYFQLTPTEFENLAIIIMLDQQGELRRLSKGEVNATSISAITKFISSALNILGLGLCRIDPFGRYVLVARMGLKIEGTDLAQAISEHTQKQNHIIEAAVRRTLPWLLSEDNSQTKLPL